MHALKAQAFRHVPGGLVHLVALLFKCGRRKHNMENEPTKEPLSRHSARLVTLSVVVLIGTEVLGVAAATAWALGGLLHLGTVITWTLGIILCAVGAYVTLRFARNVWAVEKPGRQKS